MARNEYLILRISQEDKEKIRKASTRRGESLTTFVRRVCLREADQAQRKEEKMEQLMTTRPRHTGMPSFFHFLCQDARKGGAISYWNAGYELARHTDQQSPDNADEDQWEEMLEELRDAVGNEDEDAIWDWYCKTFPKCMALVPERRKEQFVKGVLEAYENGDTDWM